MKVENPAMQERCISEEQRSGHCFKPAPVPRRGNLGFISAIELKKHYAGNYNQTFSPPSLREGSLATTTTLKKRCWGWALYIKPKMHHITILHQVLFSFNS